MQIPQRGAGASPKLARPRTLGPAETPAAPPEGSRDEISCRGHAFGEDLACSCGVTWWEHQRRPRSCRIHAQRCHRAADAGEAPLGEPAIAPESGSD
jgi:hypothetical protein